MSIQIKKKFLRSASVDGSKVLFLNEDAFKALKSDGSEASLFKLDSNDKFQLLEMPRVSSDPTHVNELGRKSYIDAGDAAEATARQAADALEAAARQAADTAEAAARVAGDASEAAAREAEDMVIRAEFAAADALSLFEAKDYTDEKVSEEAAMRSAEDEDIRSDFAAADLIEKNAREAADQLLRDDLDSEIALRASEDARVLSESKTYTDAEKTRAMAAEAAEATLRASEDVRILAAAKDYTDIEKARAMAAEAAEAALRASEDVRVLGDAKAYTDLEKVRAMAAEAAEAATRASEDNRVLGESKTYTDMSIAAVIDAAPEAYNTLREIAEYIASDQTATTQILSQLYDHETRLDVIEGTGEGSIAKAEADAMAYTDAEKVRAMAAESALQYEIDAEEATRESEDIRVLGDAKAYTDIEKARAIAAEAAEAATRASEDIRVLNDAKLYTDAEVLTEKTRAMAQEAAIRSEFAAADALIRTDLDDLDGYAQDIRSDLDQEIADRISDVNAEEVRAMAREAELQLELDSEEALRASEDIRILAAAGAYTDAEVFEEKTRAMTREAELQLEIDAEEATRASEDVRVLSEANTYTDQKVAAVIDSAPEMLDTLRELAAALNNDANFATSVTSYIASAKQEAKDYAVSQVNSLGEQFHSDFFVVSDTIIQSNYIELSYKAFAMSIVPSIDRLMLVQEEDYEVSVENGKTRLTFKNSLLPTGEEALASGDRIRVRYLKDVRV